MTGDPGSGAIFADRRAAGRMLAREIEALQLVSPVVLALPRGGVPVGFEVARALRAPLDVLMVRKIGAPGHPEYGIGALVDGAAPQVVVDAAAARAAGAGPGYIEATIARELKEIERRRALYHAGPPAALEGRAVVVVNDGIATGGTVRAALGGITRVGALETVLAVPLAPAEVLEDLAKLCDRVVCLASPEPFLAVGMHYRDFNQAEDGEVIDLLEKARHFRPPAAAPGA